MTDNIFDWVPHFLRLWVHMAEGKSLFLGHLCPLNLPQPVTEQYRPFYVHEIVKLRFNVSVYSNASPRHELSVSHVPYTVVVKIKNEDGCRQTLSYPCHEIKTINTLLRLFTFQLVSIHGNRQNSLFVYFSPTK